MVEITESKRIDSEFFDPKYLHYEATVNSYHVVQPLGQLGQFLIGPFGSAFKVSNYDPDSHYRYIRGKDVKPFRLKDDDSVYMPFEDFHRLSKYAVQEGDLLFSVVGTLGNVAIVPAGTEGIFSCKSTIFRNGTVDPYYLLAYFNSKYGRECLLRRQRGAIQTGLNKEDLKTVPVPILPDRTQEKIGGKVLEALNLVDHSHTLYQRATERLEAALGLGELRLPQPRSYRASFQEVVGSQRMDGEHFTPRFTQLEELLEKKGNVSPLLHLLSYCNRGKQPQYGDTGYPVLNSKHIRVNKVTFEDTRQATPPLLPSQLITQGDVLLNGTGVGTLGRAAPYWEEYPAIPDNHVTILRSDRLDPGYLSVYLNSLAGQVQAYKHQRGSSGQIELYPHDIKKFLIWEAPEAFQKEIGELIQTAYDKEKESQALLHQAKTEVERLIEEAAAAHA